MRGSLGRAGTGRGDRAGAVRAGSARQGRPGGLRALPAGRPRRPAGRRADRRERLGRVRGRHPGQGRPAAGAVHEPGPGAAACRPGAVRRRDPRPGRRETALRSRGVHRVPHRDAHRRPDQRSDHAGGILPGYPGTIVRDGYKGYEHLTSALHAWCGAHGLRDLAGLYRFDPDGQVWARSMADLLIDANAAATAARSAGQASLSDAASPASGPGTARRRQASPTTSTSAPRWPKTGCAWPAGSATTRT